MRLREKLTQELANVRRYFPVKKHPYLGLILVDWRCLCLSSDRDTQHHMLDKVNKVNVTMHWCRTTHSAFAALVATINSLR